MLITPNRTKIILDYLCDKHYAEYCSKYGERGYRTPECGIIIFANWNDVKRKQFVKYLEQLGAEMEWSDEWMVDYENDKCYRTSGDSYHWVCQVRWIEHGEWLTPDDDLSTWLEELAMEPGDEPQVLPDFFTGADLEALGYEQIEQTFENGFFEGQNDDPKKIAEKAFKFGAQKVIFRIKEQSQFYMKFECYALQGEKDNDDTI